MRDDLSNLEPLFIFRQRGWPVDVQHMGPEAKLEFRRLCLSSNKSQ